MKLKKEKPRGVIEWKPGFPGSDVNVSNLVLSERKRDDRGHWKML